MAIKVDMDKVTGIIRDVSATEIAPRFGQLDDADIDTKSHALDLVTIADTEAERVLADRLTDLLPGSRALGEEAAHADPSLQARVFASGDPVWIIDPVDGTKNFAHHRQPFRCMVALYDGCETVAAWIVDPITGAVTVAEKGSVVGAARTLSISQSSVTEALKMLEADLGVTLFERHARGLAITYSGHQFLRHATKILSDVSGARRAFEQPPGTTRGRLNIGVTSLMSGYVMSDLLSRYRRMNPAVDVSALEEPGDYLEHLLIGGELDVAVMVTSNLRDRMALQSEILDISQFRLWLPLEHKLTSRESIGLDDVAQEPLIMLNVDEMEEEAVKLLSAFGRRPHIAFRTRSVEAVRSLVATGAGVTLLPDLVYRPWSLDGDRIESRDVSGSLPMVQVGVAWRRGSQMTQAARDFIDLSQAQRAIRQR